MSNKDDLPGLANIEEMDLWFLISRVRKEMLMASDRELKRYKLSSVQMGILHALYNAHESGFSPNLSDIARWVFRQHNTVSVMLSTMEKKGLVTLERTPPPRSMKIDITDQGIQIYKEAMSKRKAVPAILRSLSSKERDQLKKILNKLDLKARETLLSIPFP